jgi:hypothetical protein
MEEMGLRHGTLGSVVFVKDDWTKLWCGGCRTLVPAGCVNVFCIATNVNADAGLHGRKLIPRGY